MKHPIGFLGFGSEHKESESVTAALVPQTPIKSLVQIRFPGSGRTLAYYNDRFSLSCGDAVYVSGKMAGSAGIVTDVSTKFRIHLADYEKVIALLDLTIHGDFVSVGDKMVSFGDQTITPSRFESWIIPPVDESKIIGDEDPDEVISGDGYSIDLEDIGGCDDLTQAILERALNYCQEGKVAYLAVQNGIGCAYVEGTKWYRVDFRCENGIITDLFCDCPYPYLCKHEVAVALTLRMLSANTKMEDGDHFVALDRWLFWKLASRSDSISL